MEFPRRNIPVAGAMLLTGPTVASRLGQLADACHPGRTSRPEAWWLTFPSLVMMAPIEEGLRVPVGYTTYTMIPNVLGHDGPVNGFMAMGIDHGVSPEWRRRGIGSYLLACRLVLCATAGATWAGGIVGEDNLPMLSLMERAGFEKWGPPLSRYYGDVDRQGNGVFLRAGEACFQWARKRLSQS